MKKIFYFLIIFAFFFQSTFAFGLDFFSFTNIYEFLFGRQEENNIVVEEARPRLNNFGINAEEIVQTENPNLFKKQYIKEKEYDISDIKKIEEAQKKTLQKMQSLVMDLQKPQTVSETCDAGEDNEIEKCKQDLFVGCADSLYLGLEMTPECKEFSTADYTKYLSLKKKQDENPYIEPEKISSSVGDLLVSYNPYTSVNSDEQKDTINSTSINSDFTPIDIEKELEKRKIIEPEKPVEINLINRYNIFMPIKYGGWITGWGTLFAINGGKKEAGQIMNKYTAFGYNPYHPNTCITSLPYKTIDKFFGTNLNYCIKTGNVSCIVKIKNQIKDRAIEVIMIKNGKRAIFPLGDLGPAEWTGNAIDFTQCAKKSIGATGKDLVKFRPLAG